MSGRAKEAPVRVGGRLRLLVVDFNALCTVQEITGVNITEGVERPPLPVLRALCYAALRSGARREEKPFDFDLERVGDWMEEEPQLLAEVLKLTGDAQPEQVSPGPQPVQGDEAQRLSA